MSNRWTEEDLKALSARRAAADVKALGKKKLGRSRANTASGRVEKVIVDGQVFDSKREANRWQELKLLEKAGEITDLRRQERFALVVGTVLICEYVADFTYRWGNPHLRKVVEDAKGHKTEVYRLKKKLMLAIHGIGIQEV